MSDALMIWLALSTFLVLLMQAGFACYEAGMVRRKNSVNVAIKNVADLGTSIFLYLLIGYSVMFGPSWNGVLGMGASPMLSDDPPLILTALFQAMFCGTAITIVSGAVSERTSFGGYLLLAVAMTLLVYPITGHWVWAEGGWLAEMGFFDFAGSTAVHAVGGAIALAAVILIGPRLGRFETKTGDDDGDNKRAGGRIDSDNLAVSALGAFLLMFGWFGFNSGGATDFETQVPLILVNTAVGGAVGIVVILLLGWVMRKKAGAVDILTGMLGGLVGITAGCEVLPPLGAATLGALGGLVAVWGTHLLARLRLDDPVGAIPVHLFAGVVGTALLPLFAYEHKIPPQVDGRLAWLGIQVVGTVSVSAFAFCIAWVVIRVTDPIVGFRVSPEDERIGLNVAEHGAGTAMLDLLNQLAAQGTTGDFSRAVAVERETEAGYIAAFYNQVRERFVSEAERSNTLLEEAAFLANHDPLTGLKNRRAFVAAANTDISDLNRYGGDDCLIMIDLDHFKAINDCHGHDAGDEVLVELARRLRRVARETDVIARLGGEEFGIIVGRATQDQGMISARRFLSAINGAPFALSVGPLAVTASLGVASLAQHTTFDAALKAADEALYAAKRGGRNRVCAAPATENRRAAEVADVD